MKVNGIMKRVFGMIGLGLICVVTGCVPMATDLRKEGFNLVQKGFDSLDESPTLYEVIALDLVKVHVVGRRAQFNYQRAAAYGSPVVGYATSNNEIWLFGKNVKGKIMLNQAILGHEFMHLLNFRNPRIANPDKLGDLGA
jgi:hypothetical protein